MTLRELLTILSGKRLIAIWATVTAGCVLAGPFGTIAAPLAVRAAYWPLATTVATAFSIFIVVSTQRHGPERWPGWVKSVIGSLIFAVVYAGFLTPLTSAFFGGGGAGDYLELVIYAAPIAVAIALTVELFQSEKTAEAEAVGAAPARFLKRLKPELGRDLIRLSMQDHYVEACTEKGGQLVLMRFSDALDEVAVIPGWRIHRSHWVAEAGIAGMKRESGKTLVVTRDGAELPVSRTYLPALRDAGVVKRHLG